jgi:O-antigen/teichoic acid export membrane protein
MSRKEIFSRGLLWSIISMGVSVVLSVLYQPLFLNYYGVSEYGVWTLILTIINYIGLSNIGIPTAVTVLISNSLDDDNKHEIIIKSFFLLSLITFGSLLLFGAVSYLLPDWRLLFGKIPEELVGVASRTFIVSVFFIMMRMPLQVAQSAFSGYQQIYVTKIYDMLNVPATFIAVLLGIKFKLSLVSLACITGGFYLCVSLISVVHLIIRNQELLSSLSLLRSDKVRYGAIFKTGMSFLVLGLPVTIVWSIDNIMISRFMGVDKIAAFTFSTKIMMLPFQTLNIALSVLFPMYGRALAEERYDWLKKVYTAICFLYPLMAGCIWFVSLAFGQEVIEVWSRRTDLYSGFLFSVVYGSYIYILAIINVNSSFLSGINKTAPVIRIAWYEAILHVVFGIVLINLYGFVGMALAILLSALVTAYAFLPRVISTCTDNKIRFSFVLNLKLLVFSILPCLLVCTYVKYGMKTDPLLSRILVVLFVCIVYFGVSLWIMPAEMRKNARELFVRRNQEVENLS